MATLRPFCGLRFSAEAGPLSTLVAPPYDVLSQAQRDDFASRNDANVVHLTLPESKPDDRSKFVKYARSASQLEQLVQSGKIAPEPQPAFYRYLQTFDLPGVARVTRQAVIALIKVEPYENGVVLPHEQTFPKHKEDRLRILEATRSHLECIYGLYEDPDRALFQAVGSAPAAEVARVTDEDGVEHVLEAITDAATLDALRSQFADRKVWIADGHHRYETALKFRESQGEKSGEIAEDYMMMALSSMEDPGLVLLPTHRMLKRANGDVRAALEAPYWQIEPCANADLMKTIERHQSEGKRAFGVALPGGQGVILRVDDLAAVVAQVPGDASEALKSLDVTILHEVIFAKHLGLTGLDFFDYTRVEQEALDAVENGSPAAFLMNPPSVHDMRVVANGGEKMPQKSTYYYPKILSGLVLWRLSDF